MIRLVGISAVFFCILNTAAPANAQHDGTYVGNVTCNGQYVEPQPWPLTVVVTGGVVAASTPNAAGAGAIAGNHVTFTLATFGNAAHFNGTLHGRKMSGHYVQMGSGPCIWFATKAAADVAKDAAKEVFRGVTRAVTKPPKKPRPCIRKAGQPGYAPYQYDSEQAAECSGFMGGIRG
jgi:hypothetical protein